MSSFAHPTDSFLESEIEPRTSIMAVVSIVCSLICCVPVLTGMLGAFLGVIALFLIGSSHGRLKGRGLAFGGVVLGLLVSLMWIGGAMGAVRFLGGTVNQGTTAFRAIDAGDMTEARSVFMPSLDKNISDEQIEAFGQLVRDDHGAFVSGPKTFLEYFMGFASAGQAGLTPNNQNGEMPIVLEYESGAVMVYMAMPDGTSQPKPGQMISDLGFHQADGTIVWLSEMTSGDAAIDAEPPSESGESGEDEGGNGGDENGGG